MAIAFNLSSGVTTVDSRIIKDSAGNPIKLNTNFTDIIFKNVIAKFSGSVLERTSKEQPWATHFGTNYAVVEYKRMPLDQDILDTESKYLMTFQDVQIPEADQISFKQGKPKSTWPKAINGFDFKKAGVEAQLRNNEAEQTARTTKNYSEQMLHYMLDSAAISATNVERITIPTNTAEADALYNKLIRQADSLVKKITKYNDGVEPNQIWIELSIDVNRSLDMATHFINMKQAGLQMPDRVNGSWETPEGYKFVADRNMPEGCYARVRWEGTGIFVWIFNGTHIGTNTMVREGTGDFISSDFTPIHGVKDTEFIFIYANATYVPKNPETAKKTPTYKDPAPQTNTGLGTVADADIIPVPTLTAAQSLASANKLAKQVKELSDIDKNMLNRTLENKNIEHVKKWAKRFAYETHSGKNVEKATLEEMLDFLKVVTEMFKE